MSTFMKQSFILLLEVVDGCSEFTIILILSTVELGLGILGILRYVLEVELVGCSPPWLFSEALF